MENKHVGYILLGVSVLIVIIVFMFQNALTSFVNSSCTLAHDNVASCPMFTTINQQTYLAGWGSNIFQYGVALTKIGDRPLSSNTIVGMCLCFN